MNIFNKSMGVFMILFGVFMTFFFQQTKDYQPEKFAWLNVVFGIPSIYIGLYLLTH